MNLKIINNSNSLLISVNADVDAAVCYTQNDDSQEQLPKICHNDKKDEDNSFHIVCERNTNDSYNLAYLLRL